MDFIITYQWEIFISMEVLSFLSLVLFLFIRYALKKRLLSQTFLFIFLLLLLLEGVLALVVYKATGEIETFQIIILVFLVYACTFGIADFKKLDRWIKQKVGKWQGVDLLTEKDKQIMAKERDSHAVARKYRIGWYVHTAIFIIAQSIFLLYFGNDHLSLKELMTDWSWIEEVNPAEVPENGPYRVAALYPVSVIWGIVYIADTINAWYYTIFPEK